MSDRDDELNGAGRFGRMPALFSKPGRRAIVLVLLVAGLIYVGLAWTPSHYSMALTLVGHSDTSPVFGRARPIRSDEYSVLTPYFQISVRNQFADRNTTSPYKESLKSFHALPIADAGLVFKPQLWGFFLLPPAHAYSLYFFSLGAAFIVGYAILLRQLGAGEALAVAGSLLLFLSHFVQAWWTSNATAFALAPWPAIAFLAPWRPLWRWVAVFYATTVWLVGLLYPPLIIAGASALALLTVAFRRDACRPHRLLIGASAIVAAAAVTWLYLGEILEVMRNTVYPGQRHSGGGGVPAGMLLAHLLPYWTTYRFEPLLPESNECEIAVVASFLPLGFLAFTEYRSLSEIVRTNPFTITVLSLGALAMLAWMILPIPAPIGGLVLWDRVPGSRMLWGFGLLVTLGLTVLASHVRWRATVVRSVVFILVVLAGWLSSKAAFLAEHPVTALYRTSPDWLVLGPFALALVYLRYARVTRDPQVACFTVFVVASALTFGTFNPVQSAKPIFDPPRIAFVEKARQRSAEQPDKFVVLDGLYGAILNGLGVPAINHVLLMPQLTFFRPFFPELPDAAFNEIFNRYAHIGARDITRPVVPQPDVIIVPIRRFDGGEGDH